VLVEGLRSVRNALVVSRELLNPTETFVPVRKPCE